MTDYKIFRKVLIIYACYMTYIVVEWSMYYTSVSTLDGLQIAAVIAAVQTPIIALNGYLAKLHIEKING